MSKLHLRACEANLRVTIFDGIARVLSDNESQPLIALFKKKYRMFKMMFKEDREGEKKSFFFEITLK